MAENLINTMFSVFKRPDVIMQKVIHQMFTDVNSKRSNNIQESCDNMDIEDIKPVKNKIWELSKLLFVVGHVALKQWWLLEWYELCIKRKNASNTNNPTKPNNNNSLNGNLNDFIFRFYDQRIGDGSF